MTVATDIAPIRFSREFRNLADLIHRSEQLTNLYGLLGTHDTSNLRHGSHDDKGAVLMAQSSGPIVFTGGAAEQDALTSEATTNPNVSQKIDQTDHLEERRMSLVNIESELISAFMEIVSEVGEPLLKLSCEDILIHAVGIVDRMESTCGNKLQTLEDLQVLLNNHLAAERATKLAAEKVRAAANLDYSRRQLNSTWKSFAAVCSHFLRQEFGSVDTFVTVESIRNAFLHKHHNDNQAMRNSVLNHKEVSNILTMCTAACQHISSLLLAKCRIENVATISTSTLHDILLDADQCALLASEIRTIEHFDLGPLLIQFILQEKLQEAMPRIVESRVIPPAIISLYASCCCERLALKSLLNFVGSEAHLRCEKTLMAVNDANVNANAFSKSCRQLAESLASSIKLFSRIIFPEDGKLSALCAAESSLAMLSSIVRVHATAGNQLCKKLSGFFSKRAESMDLDALADLLEHSANVCSQSLIVEQYIIQITGNLINVANQDGPQGFNQRVISERRRLGIEKNLVEIESVDASTGLTPECFLWVEGRRQLISDHVGTEALFMNKACDKAVANDDVPLDWSETHGFASLLPVHLQITKIGAKVTDSPSAEDEKISAVGGGSTLPDDYYFVISESLNRVLKFNDVQACCATLNNAHHRLSTLPAELLQRVQRALPMFVTIISQNWPFTLSRLVPLLPRDVIMLGHLTSAYSLPHALQNISLCSVYLKKLLSQVDEYVELESLPASTKNLLDDACDNVRSLVPVFTNYFQQATKRTAKELYMAVLARDVNQLLKSFSWNVDQTSYNKAREEADAWATCIESTTDRLRKLIGNCVSPEVYSSILVNLCDETLTPLYDKALNLKTTVDLTAMTAVVEEPITILGALEFDAKVRTVIKLFAQHTETNLRARHCLIHEVCDLLATQSIEEIHDLIKIGGKKIWAMPLELCARLTLSRIDFESPRDELAKFLLDLRKSGPFA